MASIGVICKLDSIYTLTGAFQGSENMLCWQDQLHECSVNVNTFSEYQTEFFSF